MRNLIFLLIITTSYSVNAEQIDFTRKYQKDAIDFSYAWRVNEESKRVSFQVDRKAFLSHFRHVKGYRWPILADRQYRAVKLWQRENDVSPSAMNVSTLNNEMTISLRAPDQETLAQWNTELSSIKKDVTEEYLDENYLLLYGSKINQLAIYPDHERYIKESKAPLSAIINTFKNEINSPDPRKSINYVLGWVQSIPYDDLENRQSSNGSGYHDPIKVLLNNKGDCDSKSVLAAAIIQGLLPKRNVAIIYIANHAFIGIQMNPVGDEKTANIDGQKYVIMEPTGPAQLPLGKVGATSQLAIDNGRYSWRVALPNND